MSSSAEDLELVNLELSSFDKPVYQTTHIKSYTEIQHIDNRMASTDENTPLYFKIPKNAGVHVSLRECKLDLVLTIVEVKNGAIANLTADAKVALTNFVGASLFRDVVLRVNNTKLEGDNSLYPWKAYIYTLFSLPDASKTFQFQTAGWFKDVPTAYDTEGNRGFVTRKAWTAESRDFEISTYLYLDAALQPRLMSDQMDIELTFHRAPHKFAIESHQAPAATTEYKVSIKEANLLVKYRTIAGPVIEAHLSGLNNEDARWFGDGYRVIPHHIPKSTINIVIPDCAKGVYPKQIIACLISSDAYNGSLTKKPYNFQNFKVKEAHLQCNGQYVSVPPIITDFTRGGGTNPKINRAYSQLYEAIGRTGMANDTFGLTMTDFIGGMTFWAWDLTPDGIIGGHWQPQRLSNIQLTMNLAEAVTDPVVLLLYCTIQTQFTMDKSFNVFLDPTQTAA
jgi:hypothetical protein